MKWTKRKPNFKKPCIILVHNSWTNETTAYDFIKKDNELQARDLQGYWVGMDSFDNDNQYYARILKPERSKE